MRGGPVAAAFHPSRARRTTHPIDNAVAYQLSWRRRAAALRRSMNQMQSTSLSPPISVANSLVSPCRIKAVVQAELRGMNAGKLVIEAELPARDCNSPRSGGEATRFEAVA